MYLSMQTGYSLRNFTGHSASVMSLDFHPNKDDLICSCDDNGEIRYWSINNGSCARVFKVKFYKSICYLLLGRKFILHYSRGMYMSGCLFNIQYCLVH